MTRLEVFLYAIVFVMITTLAVKACADEPDQNAYGYTDNKIQYQQDNNFNPPTGDSVWQRRVEERTHTNDDGDYLYKYEEE